MTLTSQAEFCSRYGGTIGTLEKRYRAFKRETGCVRNWRKRTECDHRQFLTWVQRRKVRLNAAAILATIPKAKACAYCLKDLPVSAFSTRRASPDGLAYACRGCSKAYKDARGKAHYKKLKDTWHKRNKVSERKKALQRYKDNREQRMAAHSAYMARTKDRQKAYRIANRAAYSVRDSVRRVQQKRGTPAWLTDEQKQHMRVWYVLRDIVIEQTGRKWHVDHIVPLQGKLVSGLHVPWNMQLLEAKDNLSKGNRHEV